MPSRKPLIALLLAGAVLTGSFATVETAAAGTRLSKKTALKKTAKLARKIARKQRSQGATTYFAYGCARKSRRVVVCIGGVGYRDNSACVQRVRNRRRGARVVTRRFGPIACGDLPREAGGGGGGGGEETAICGIRQSVCI